MIAQLTGTIASEHDTGLIIDVNGVGYEVFCSRHTREDLNATRDSPGGSVTIFIETIVREDLINLYGFATREEKSCFQLLRSVQGVGNRMAISILSLFRPSELIQTLHAQDKTSLIRADGVGPKLATRLITELKDKVGGITILSAGTGSAIAPTRASHDGVVSALINLGYARMEATNALQKVHETQSEGLKNESELIKGCLRYLAQG